MTDINQLLEKYKSLGEKKVELENQILDIEIEILDAQYNILRKDEVYLSIRTDRERNLYMETSLKELIQKKLRIKKELNVVNNSLNYLEKVLNFYKEIKVN
jgi:hypothetical protein